MAASYITIGRQFGSRGREIGKLVAQALGFPYYDKDLLAVAAEESGLSHEFLKTYDEKPTNSFLYSLVMGQNHFLPGAQGITVEQLAAKAQRDAVVSVADKGRCVIVGRCADYILRDREGLVRLFLCADLDDRIAHVRQRDDIPAKEAADKIRKLDKARASYYAFHTDRQWGAAESYDLCVNSSLKGIDATAQLILQFCKA